MINIMISILHNIPLSLIYFRVFTLTGCITPVAHQISPYFAPFESFFYPTLRLLCHQNNRIILCRENDTVILVNLNTRKMKHHASGSSTSKCRVGCLTPMFYHSKSSTYCLNILPFHRKKSRFFSAPESLTLIQSMLQSLINIAGSPLSVRIK